MRYGQAYYRWSRRISQLLPSIEVLLYALPCMELRQRKAILVACRVQSAPYVGSRLYERMKDAWNSRIPKVDVSMDMDYEMRRGLLDVAGLWLRDLAESAAPCFESSIYSGFLSAVVRSAPIFFPHTYEDSKEELFWKELHAAIHIYPNNRLNYTAFTSNNREDRMLPFAQNIAPAPHVAEEIHVALESLRSLYQNRILFPRTSRKTVGSEVEQRFWKDAPSHFTGSVEEEVHQCGGITTRILQRLKYWEGIEIDGPVEMRSAWKYNDLKPRVYYATGGTAFHASKYLQEFFNDFADLVRPVNRKSRYNPPTEALRRFEDLIIYDYASFTSQLQEHVRFIHALSIFFKGTTVFLPESVDGLETCDLGEMLERYNTECNFYAEFDVSRFLPGDIPNIMAHTCGMLGVIGNIQSCTILHGIHLAFAVGSAGRCRCIGDDAKAYVDTEEPNWRDHFISQLQNIGEVSLEKTEVFPYTTEDDYHLQAWHYAKRPIMRYHNRVIQFDMFTFPTLDVILGLHDPLRTVPTHDENARKTKFAMVWTRVLAMLFVNRPELEHEECRFLLEYQKSAFRELGLLRGDKPGYTERDGRVWIQPIFAQLSDFGQDPVNLACQYYSFEERVRLPRPGLEVGYPYGYVGEEFESRSTRLYAYLEELGYLSKRQEFEEIGRCDIGDVEFGQRLLGRVTQLYTYTILLPVPIWARTQLRVPY